jgi:hypothetical protein
LTESLKKQAKIEYLDDEFNPKTVKKGIQTEMNMAPQRAKAAKEDAARKSK